MTAYSVTYNEDDINSFENNMDINTFNNNNDSFENDINPDTMFNSDNNENKYIDFKGKFIISPEKFLDNKIFLGKYNVNLDECKTKCDENIKCHWLQHSNKENSCYLYSLENNSNVVLQLRKSKKIISGYSVNQNIDSEGIIIPANSPEECHSQCNNNLCLYSEFNTSLNIPQCKLFYMFEDNIYTVSFNNLGKKKLTSDELEVSTNIMGNENENENIRTGSHGEYYISVYTLYGLTIIILVLVAIILCIFKKRSDNEKMLLYTLSNITANSQSRSRSKSSPSENMSYLNSGSYFQNTFNASSITINPDTIENFSQKHSKGTSHTGTSIKKSKRKSSSSKAPSIHSISTLCNGNSSPNNVQDNSQNDKSYHNLSLSTKKSSYNYSIKTFSAKDPSLTGLSQNIKTLFANSYNGTSDTNSYYETFSTLPTNSPKIDSSYDNVLYKDNVTSSSIKTMYGQHKKQNSSISITIPKISNSNTINVSPKNSYSAGGNLIAVSSPQQQRVIKIKKPVHTKQFSVSKSVYSEPMLPINTDNSEILLHDDLDGISYIEPQDQISFNGNSIPSVTIVNTTKVK